MRIANLITHSLLIAALSVGLAEASPAQGGWRQWEVRLRDGRRLEANPLGAPDDTHLSLSVGAYERREGRIARSLVNLIAVLPADSMAAGPVVASCEDAIVRRDGTRTAGHITLAHVRWSEGVVVQRGDTIDLRDVAYLVFAGSDRASDNCWPEAAWQQAGVPYPVGRRQVPRRCARTCWT
jgi:hypothetical protein